MRRKLAAGNWKMHGSAAQLSEITTLKDMLAETMTHTDVVVCPPALFLPAAVASVQKAPSGFAIGAQDCHSAADGAHTGDIAAPMISEIGARYVILGHSERRESYGETDADVRAKATAAHGAGLTAIICIGESEEERENGVTLDRLAAQLTGSVPDAATGANTVIAYEPIWAIGTGRVPSLEQIAEVHDALRADLNARFGAEGNAIRLLYGGSVKPSNAAEIFTCANVDGALVGGASLKAADFAPIALALQQSA